MTPLLKPKKEGGTWQKYMKEGPEGQCFGRPWDEVTSLTGEASLSLRKKLHRSSWMGQTWGKLSL